MTIVIIAVTAACFGLQYLVPNQGLVYALGYVPALTTSQPWRLITTALVHDQGFVFHLLFNMYTLWIFGRFLEPLMGPIRFLSIYLLSAIGGSAGVLLFASGNDWVTVTIGASGAIFGLFGVALATFKRTRQKTAPLLILIGINLAIGFFVANISWEAHVGGAITGFLAGLVLAYAPQKGRNWIQAVGLAILLLVLVAAMAGKLLLSSPSAVMVG